MQKESLKIPTTNTQTVWNMQKDNWHVKINACSSKTMSIRSFLFVVMWTQWLTLILQARNNRSSFALNTSHVQHHDRIWLPSTQRLPEVWLHGPKGVEMRNVSERRGSNSYLHLPVRRTLWIDFPWPETQSITNPLCFICTRCQKDPASDPVYAYLRCVRKPKVNAWFNFFFVWIMSTEI